MKLTLVIPAQNEEGCIRETVASLYKRLTDAQIPYEIIVVNDHCEDNTGQILSELSLEFAGVRWVNNTQRPSGFGYAVQTGLDQFEGDAVCIVMADGSDDPDDVVKYYYKLEEGFECVFGSRFTKQSKVHDYPFHKLIINRLANWFIQILFGLRYNDVTNAFKCYRRQVIEGVKPILSCHFNLTVELPLKAIVRGYSYAVVPINWYGRLAGLSKMRIKEMGSRYMFIILYVLLEKLLSRGDYRKKDRASESKPALNHDRTSFK